jgi:tape measure domain-containing protein
MAILIESRSDSKIAREDLAKLNKSVEGIKTSVDKTTASFAGMAKTITNTLAGISFVSFLAKQSDGLTRYRNRLKVVSDSQEEFLNSFKELRRIAFRTASDLDSVTTLYNRLALSGKRLGASQSDLLKITELVGKSLKIAGASTQEANSALIQFGQAIASGRLAGDELRSILENAPTLALTIAENIGVSIGELRKMGAEGTLTAQRILVAILQGAEETERRFEQMGATYASAFTRLGLAFKELWSNAKDQLFGTSNALAEFINNTAKRIQVLAENIDFYIYKVQMAIAKTTIGILGLFSTTTSGFRDLIVQMSSMAASAGMAIFGVAFSFVKMLPTLVNVGVEAIKDLFVRIKEYYSEFSFEYNFAELFFGSLAIAAASVTSFVNNMFKRIREIDVMKFFPGLGKGLEYVKSWAKSVNEWFKWLWDKVVGNSWVPDMVTGVTSWLSKLNGPALSYVNQFASAVSSIFGSLGKSVISFFAVKGLFEYRKALLTIASILAGIVGLIGLLSFDKIGSIFKRDNQQARGSDQTEQVSILRTIADRISEIGQDIFNRIKRLFVRTETDGLEQSQLDNNAVIALPNKIARILNETFANIGGLLVNSFKSNENILASVLAGIILLATRRAAGGIRLVIAAAVFKAWSFVVKEAEVSLGQRIGKGISDTIQGSLNLIFGNNVISDFKRTAIGLGIALTLFSSSFRGGLASAGLGILRAPTNLANQLTQRTDLSFAQRGLQETRLEIQSQSSRFESEIARLQGLRDRSVFANEKAIDSQITALQKSQKDTLEPLLKRQEALEGKAAKLKEGLDNATAAFKASVVNFTTALGGAIGGVAGYQFGRRIVDAINDRRDSDLSEWQEWAITLGTAMGGQAAGALIGQLGGRLAVTIGTALFGAISAPFLLGAATIGLVLATFTEDGREIIRLVVTALFDGAWWIFDKLVEGGIQVAKTIADYFKNDFKKDLLSAFNAVRDSFTESNYIEGLKSSESPNEFSAKLYAPLLAFLLKYTNQFAGRPERIPSRASGGAIYGPGSGTSDSILARLSNGEYVINAKSTKKYRPLIEAINSGNLPKFAKGGEITSKREGFVQRSVSKTEEVVDRLKNFSSLASDTALGAWLATHLALSKFRKAPLVEPLLTEGFNSDNFSGRISNFFSGDAQDYIYDILKETGKQVITKMAAANTLLLIPGIGGLLKMANLVMGLGLPSLQGALKASLDHGLFSEINANGLLDKFVEIGDLDLIGKLFTGRIQQFLMSGLSGFASGGAINGPGSGTSDSILARLSNGEYVINAKSTKKYRPLVEAINKGSLPGFNTGGFVGPMLPSNGPVPFSDPVPVVIVEDRKKNIVEEGWLFVAEKFDEFIAVFKDSSKNLEAEVRYSVFDSAESIAEAITKGLTENSRITAFSATQVAELNAKQSEELLEVLSNIEQFNSVLADPKSNILQKNTAQGALDNSRQLLDKLLVRIANAGNVSGLANLPKDLGTLGEQFEALSKNLPNLSVSFSEFVNLSSSLRETLVESATAIGSRFEAIENLPFGSEEDPSTLFKQAEAFRESSLNAFNRILNTTRTTFDGLSTRLKNSGVELDRYAYDMLSDFELLDVQNLTNGLQDAMLDLVTKQRLDSGATRAEIQIAQGVVEKLNRDLDEILELASMSSSDKFTDTSNKLSRFGISLSQSLFNRMTEVERAAIKATLVELNDADAMSRDDEEEIRIAGQRMKDEIMFRLQQSINRQSDDFQSQMLNSGVAFASNVENAFSSGLSSALRGQRAEGKSIFETFAKGLLDNITGNIIDTFTQGVTKSLFSDKIKNQVASAGENLFKVGGKLLGSLLGGSSGGLGSVLSLFGGGQKYASGGMVGGTGSGVSDSNLIWASKGEYVVKANATKKHLAVLEAINSGRIDRFANGGLVGDARATPEINSVAGQSVFNINITGDISRQTRSEIAKMLPELATGVNSYNRETGYRG